MVIIIIIIPLSCYDTGQVARDSVAKQYNLVLAFRPATLFDWEGYRRGGRKVMASYCWVCDRCHQQADWLQLRITPALMLQLR